MFKKIQQYSKLVGALIAVTLTAGTGLIAPAGLEWLSLVAALVGLVAVWQAPKNTEPVGK